MKTQKQSRIDFLEKKINEQSRLLELVISEVNNIRTLSLGTLSTVKLMPGYEEAIASLKEKDINL